MPSKNTDILPERSGETDEERRLREAVNRMTGQLMTSLDAAIRLRSAPSEAQKIRHLARGSLVDFAIKAMHAQSIVLAERRAPRVEE